jgi:hypothetical protein
MKEKSEIDTGLQVEAYSLQQVLHKKLLNLSVSDLSETLTSNPYAAQEESNILKNVENSLELCFDTHQILFNATKDISETNDHAKVLFRFSKLTDKILRKLEDSEGNNA